MDRMDTLSPDAQEILNLDPSPRLIVDKNGQINFSNQAFQKLIPKDLSSKESHTISDYTSCFGGPENLTELIANGANGQASIVAPVDTEDGPKLIQWDFRKIGENYMCYGKELNIADETTGLFNRAYLEAEIKRIDNIRDMPISVIFVDADDLKKFNDQNDHTVGDTYLYIIAQILIYSLRSNDIVGRWGGDEDLILLPKTNGEDARTVEDRIHANKNELNQFLGGDLDYESLSPAVKTIVDNCRDKEGFNEITSIAFTTGLHLKTFGDGPLVDTINKADRTMADKKHHRLKPDEAEDRIKYAASFGH